MESTLGLVIDYKGVAFLFSDATYKPTLTPITCAPLYVKWLVNNSMDLLELAQRPDGFYRDGDNDDRQEDFLLLLKGV